MKSIDALRREVCRNGSDRTVMLVAGYIGKIEQEIKEHYIELPKDADGDVWRVGDLVVGEVNPRNPKRIERMLWYGTDSGWQLETDSIIYPCPERPRHYHALNVEDVLEDALNKAANLDRKEGYWPSAADITNIVNEIAPKLQLREAE